MRPAAFLDRDGTLNVEKNYLYRIEDWEWIPGAVDAIAQLNDAGYAVIVVTNQAGIARGLYGESDLQDLHLMVDADVRRAGARVDGFYFCPHHPEHGARVACHCRKPEPGMLLQAAADHALDLGRSFMIGDRESDIEAGRRCGAQSLLVATGYGVRTRREHAADAPYFPSVVEAVAHIVGAARGTPSSGPAGRSR
jgi:D-glycero-D-manno-heptose 1,7-bisphosphate phosphatase